MLGFGHQIYYTKKPQPLRAVVLESRSIVYYLPPSALAPETISSISLVIAA